MLCAGKSTEAQNCLRWWLAKACESFQYPVYHGNLPYISTWVLGLAEPIYFYSYYVLEWNSVLLPITFLIGVIVTNSIGAGIVSAMAFIFNFGEATRVMWTPPLRESWAFPAIHLHLLLFSYMTRYCIWFRISSNVFGIFLANFWKTRGEY